MTAEQTLNVTVAQIEDALLAGQTVPDFAREWSEPPANVLAIYRRLQREGRIPVNGPAQLASVPQTRPLASASQGAATVGPPSLDALANAAARSSSKRTQVLGVKLADLAAVVRARLAEEKDAAEKAEQVARERTAAAAEVERLESMLRDAKARLRPSRQGGVRSMPPRSGTKRPISDEQRAKMLAGQRNETPCDRGCGFVAKTKSGKSAHERNCAGAS